MNAVLTHLGGSLPGYAKDCLSQFRLFNPDLPTFMIGAREHLEREAGLLREWGVRPVFSEDLESDPRIIEFRKKSWFRGHATPKTVHPSQPDFWQLTTERLFFIASLMERDGLADVFHFENDVLVYCDLRGVLDGLGRCGSPGLCVTPVGRLWASCGLLYAAAAASLRAFCDFVLAETRRTEKEVRRAHGLDMVNDMTLLKAYGDRSGALSYFPVLPRGRHSRNAKAFGAIFDGASWGQFAGGTNNGGPPGWAGAHHYVGKELLRRNVALRWEGDGLWIPHAVDRKGRKTRINTLHMHSKRLSPFLSRSAAPPEAPLPLEPYRRLAEFRRLLSRRIRRLRVAAAGRAGSLLRRLTG
jgi:hypothetical protein